jgi:2,3-diketo-5-methylthio-1-phosphopentane phosphatase
MSSIQAVVLDIEGTTTPITFVHDVLFPYIKNQLKQHLTSTFDEQQTQSDIKALANQAQQDLADNGQYSPAPQINVNSSKDVVIQQVVNNVEYNMNVDRKMTALKQLQGHIWLSAYQSGEIKGQIYDDVLPMFEHWKTSGKDIFIYSSGSVSAQKLLFTYSDKKYNDSYDLTSYLSGHFDTQHPGSKLEAESYRIIANDINKEPSQILFVTDNVNEAIAAKIVGYNVVLSVRPGTAKLPENHGFPVVTSFDQILKIDF